MTSQDAWHVARRVLGIYFIVLGLLYAASAFMAIGIMVPPGSSRAGMLVAVLMQGAISIAAGMILVRGRATEMGSGSIAVEPLAFSRVALQLLGIFFGVNGASALAKAGVGAWMIEAGWEPRASELTGAAVQIIAAILLITRPDRMATMLQKYER